MYLSKPTENTTPRINSKMYNGLGVIMIYQCRFILGKKQTNNTILMEY